MQRLIVLRVLRCFAISRTAALTGRAGLKERERGKDSSGSLSKRAGATMAEQVSKSMPPSVAQTPVAVCVRVRFTQTKFCPSPNTSKEGRGVIITEGGAIIDRLWNSSPTTTHTLFLQSHLIGPKTIYNESGATVEIVVVDMYYVARTKRMQMLWK